MILVQIITWNHCVTYPSWGCYLQYAIFIGSFSCILPVQRHLSTTSLKWWTKDSRNSYAGGPWNIGDSTEQAGISHHTFLIKGKGYSTLDTYAKHEQKAFALMQEHQDRMKNPRTHWTRPLNTAEPNYDTRQRKGLTVVWKVFYYSHDWKVTSFAFVLIKIRYLDVSSGRAH